jgi:hypothetical protein
MTRGGNGGTSADAQSNEHVVAVVVDPTFGERLWNLARTSHVWIVKSPDNEEAAQALWRGEHDDPAAPRKDVTLFNATGESPDSDFLSIIDDVELHHGEDSYPDSPANVIEVIGTPLADAVRESLAALGFERFEPSASGGVAFRDE